MKPLLLSILVFSSAAILSAEEPAAGRRLPEPGTWIKYLLEDVSPEGRQKIGSEEHTIKFLSEETHDGKQYVRIEIVVEVLEPVHRRHVTKVLLVIRKQALLTGELQKSDIKLLICKLASLPSRDETSEVSDPLGRTECIMVAVLSGGLRDWDNAHLEGFEESDMVDSQRGRVKSSQKVTICRSVENMQSDRKMQLIMTNMLHDVAPNGVLEATLTWEESRFDKETESWSEYRQAGSSYRLTLLEFGKGAEATLKE